MQTRYGIEITEINAAHSFIGTADGMGYGAPMQAIWVRSVGGGRWMFGSPTVPITADTPTFDEDRDSDTHAAVKFINDPSNPWHTSYDAGTDQTTVNTARPELDLIEREGTGAINFRGIEQAESETVDSEVAAWKLDGSRFISAEVAHRITADFTSACFLPDMPSVLNGYPVNAGWFLEVTLKGYAELVKWAERFDSVENAQTMHLIALAAWIAHNSRGNL